MRYEFLIVMNKMITEGMLETTRSSVPFISDYLIQLVIA
jgi:hypothetical protein